MHTEERRVRYLDIASQKEASDLLLKMAVAPDVIREMLPKMIHLQIIIEKIESSIAAKIKEKIASFGGDAILANGINRSNIAHKDVILCGTLRQIKLCCEAMTSQSDDLGGVAVQVNALLENVFKDSMPLRTARRRICVGKKTLIMGILNVTPDSFSDGGSYFDHKKAVAQGIRMAAEGADIIDIGGESTRPGSDAISVEEELRRVIPVVRDLSKQVDIPLSIDTMKGEVARAALTEGAEIVNDVSAMYHDNRMRDVIANTGAAVIVMHMRGTPKVMQTGDLSYRSILGDVIAFLEKGIADAVESGIDLERIIVDPGLGFGKSADDNLRIIRHLGEFKTLGRPVMIGASRKSFIGKITGGVPQDRTEGSVAAAVAAIMNGCHIIRVHDVSIMKKAAAVADAIMQA